MSATSWRNRILLALLVLVGLAGTGQAQQTTVSATVVDPRGFAYNGGTGNWAIQCTGNGQPYINGSPVSRTQPISGLSSTGFFQSVLWDTSFITDVNNSPLSCQWRVSITESCGVTSFSVTVTGVTGSSPVDLSSQINAAAPDLSPACTPPGIVQSVTVGGLSPLFTAANVGTLIAPNWQFTRISQSQNLFYASPNGSSGVPTFRAIVAADLPAGTGTVTNVTASAPITSSGGATPNIACPTCVTSVNGTSNQITSSGGTTPTLSIPSTFIAPGSIQATTSLTGTSVTDSGLTNGRCVQAGVGGLLGNASAACAAFSGATQIEAATISSPCTPPSSSSFDACNSTITWPHTFADANYVLTCTAFGTGYNTGTAGNNNANLIYVNAQIAASATITIQNGRGSQDTPTKVYCLAVHP